MSIYGIIGNDQFAKAVNTAAPTTTNVNPAPNGGSAGIGATQSSISAPADDRNWWQKTMPWVIGGKYPPKPVEIVTPVTPPVVTPVEPANPAPVETPAEEGTPWYMLPFKMIGNAFSVVWSFIKYIACCCGCCDPAAEEQPTEPPAKQDPKPTEPAKS